MHMVSRDEESSDGSPRWLTEGRGRVESTRARSSPTIHALVFTPCFVLNRPRTVKPLQIRRNPLAVYFARTKRRAVRSSRIGRHSRCGFAPTTAVIDTRRRRADLTERRRALGGYRSAQQPRRADRILETSGCGATFGVTFYPSGNGTQRMMSYLLERDADAPLACDAVVLHRCESRSTLEKQPLFT